MCVLISPPLLLPSLSLSSYYVYSVCLCATCIAKCFSVNFLLLLVYPLSYIHSLSDLSTITHYVSTGHMIADPTVHYSCYYYYYLVIIPVIFIIIIVIMICYSFFIISNLCICNKLLLIKCLQYPLRWLLCLTLPSPPSLFLLPPLSLLPLSLSALSLWITVQIFHLTSVKMMAMGYNAMQNFYGI